MLSNKNEDILKLRFVLRGYYGTGKTSFLLRFTTQKFPFKKKQ